MSPILVTLMSRSDSDFERSNISLKENKRDGVDPNSNGLDYCVRKNEGRILWFSADCMVQSEEGDGRISDESGRLKVSSKLYFPRLDKKKTWYSLTWETWKNQGI